MLKEIKTDLQKLADSKKAEILSGFFKTGVGQYGEGDIFLGITVPDQRRVSKKYPNLNLDDIEKLLSSKIHEHRLTSLFLLIHRYQKSGNSEKKKIFNFYLKNTRNINNWDLVDLSAHQILGDYMIRNPEMRNILYKLADSENLWEKRVSIISTLAFIRKGKFEDTLKISEILLNDKHDLIQKAVGWMLREIGKRDQKTEERFLKKHYKTMPRTTLRYAIERFDASKRKFYMS